MKRIPLILLIAVAVAVALLPEGATGQSVDTVYVGSHHSPVAAGVLEFFAFPTAGFAYAGDWSRGFLPAALRVGSGIGFLSTYDDANDECSQACAAWAAAWVASTVWSVVGAVVTAKDYNARMREPSGLVLVEPSPNGGISLGIRLAPS